MKIEQGPEFPPGGPGAGSSIERGPDAGVSRYNPSHVEGLTELVRDPQIFDLLVGSFPTARDRTITLPLGASLNGILELGFYYYQQPRQALDAMDNGGERYKEGISDTLVDIQSPTPEFEDFPKLQGIIAGIVGASYTKDETPYFQAIAVVKGTGLRAVTISPDGTTRLHPDYLENKDKEITEIYPPRVE